MNLVVVLKGRTAHGTLIFGKTGKYIRSDDMHKKLACY